MHKCEILSTNVTKDSLINVYLIKIVLSDTCEYYVCVICWLLIRKLVTCEYFVESTHNPGHSY